MECVSVVVNDLHLDKNRSCRRHIETTMSVRTWKLVPRTCQRLAGRHGRVWLANHGTITFVASTDPTGKIPAEWGRDLQSKGTPTKIDNDGLPALPRSWLRSDEEGPEASRSILLINFDYRGTEYRRSSSEIWR